MKSSFLLSLLCSLVLVVGCSKKDAAAPSASSSAAPAPAAASQGPRVINIDASDTMKFSVTRIEATPGESLKVALHNKGTLPKEAMGHNWVLLKAGTDPLAFCQAAVAAKATDYVPAAEASKVIVHTKLLGPKQVDEVSFKAPTEPGEYPFVCSFPAHAMSGMKGVLVVK
ncbi:MAG: azurin [Opitutaceae bacterium]|nr:azurin [Opitutaceae bacterium]